MLARVCAQVCVCVWIVISSALLCGFGCTPGKTSARCLCLCARARKCVCVWVVISYTLLCGFGCTPGKTEASSVPRTLLCLAGIIMSLAAYAS